MRRTTRSVTASRARTHSTLPGGRVQQTGRFNAVPDTVLTDTPLPQRRVLRRHGRFQPSTSWSHPPTFSFTGTPPPGVKLRTDRLLWPQAVPPRAPGCCHGDGPGRLCHRVRRTYCWPGRGPGRLIPSQQGPGNTPLSVPAAAGTGRRPATHLPDGDPRQSPLAPKGRAGPRTGCQLPPSDLSGARSPPLARPAPALQAGRH